jgi:hypothetical protein
MFNVTFNNISAMSWRSVSLVEETGVPVKTTDLSQVTKILCSRLERGKKGLQAVRVSFYF